MNVTWRDVWTTYVLITLACGLLSQARFVQMVATGTSYDLAVVRAEGAMAEYPNPDSWMEKKPSKPFKK